MRARRAKASLIDKTDKERERERRERERERERRRERERELDRPVSGFVLFKI